MVTLRDTEQAALAELHASGSGLLLRYRSLIDADMDARLSNILSAICEARAPLLDRLAHCTRQRDDQPTAADQEANQLQAVMDRVVGWLGDVELPVARVFEAEQQWLSLLDEAQSQDWSADEGVLLARLRDDARESLRHLSSLSRQVD